ncbi:MAG: hypothetical protein WCW01_00045 [Gammaproteobacteria bacterium]
MSTFTPRPSSPTLSSSLISSENPPTFTWRANENPSAATGSITNSGCCCLWKDQQISPEEIVQLNADREEILGLLRQSFSIDPSNQGDCIEISAAKCREKDIFGVSALDIGALAGAGISAVLIAESVLTVIGSIQTKEVGSTVVASFFSVAAALSLLAESALLTLKCCPTACIPTRHRREHEINQLYQAVANAPIHNRSSKENFQELLIRAQRMIDDHVGPQGSQVPVTESTRFLTQYPLRSPL